MSDILVIENLISGVPLIKVFYSKTQRPFVNKNGTTGALINDVIFEIMDFSIDFQSPPHFNISIENDPIVFDERKNNWYQSRRHPLVKFPDNELAIIRDYILKKVYP